MSPETKWEATIYAKNLCNLNFLRAQELAPAEKNSTDLSAMSAAFSISASMTYPHVVV